MSKNSNFNKIKTFLEALKFIQNHVKTCCQYKKGEDEDIYMCNNIFSNCPIPGDGVTLLNKSIKFGTKHNPPCKKCGGGKQIYNNADVQWLYDTYGKARFDHAVEWLTSIANNTDFTEELELIYNKYGPQEVEQALNWLRKKSGENDLSSGIKWLLNKVKE